MKRMVAEFEPVFRPHAEGLDALIHFAELVKLPFVRKTDSWNLLVAQRSEKLDSHLNHFISWHVGVCCWKVVNGDGDFTLRWRLSTKKQTREKHKYWQQELGHYVHRRGHLIFQGRSPSLARPRLKLSAA